MGHNTVSDDTIPTIMQDLCQQKHQATNGQQPMANNTHITMAAATRNGPLAPP
jgi:hypothetical protein